MFEPRTKSLLPSLTALLLLVALHPGPARAQCPALPPEGAELGDEVLGEDFTSDYRVWRLPQLTGTAVTNAQPGGVAIDPVDPDVFYIVDNAETADTALLRVRVVRDACGHVTGWDGDAELVANIPYGDANILHGPVSTLLFPMYPENALGQLQSWSAASPPTTTWTTDLTALGVDLDGSVGAAGLAWVPVGYDNAGELYLQTYSGELYALPFTADGDTGQLTLSDASFLVTLPNGPGGLTYIPLGSPVLTDRRLLVLEYDNDSVAYYAVDANGVPDPESRVEMLSSAAGAWGGGFVDPISGDLYWSAWSGDEQIHVVSGFALPECVADSACHATQWCNGGTFHCVEKVANGDPLPTDPDHDGAVLDGTCTEAAAAAACLSGVCDAASDTCGLIDGATCEDAAECQSAACTDHVCGTGAPATGSGDSGCGCGPGGAGAADGLLLLGGLLALTRRRRTPQRPSGG